MPMLTHQPISLTQSVQALSTSLQAIQPSNSEATQLITYTLIGVALVGMMVYHYIKHQEAPTIESKSVEYKALIQANFAHGVKTQKAIVAIALAIFLLLALAFFWPDKPNGVQWKYLALGTLISYTVPSALSFKVQK
ncbi:8946_t:CDS:2 [Entrophospora sp. SA101]|nr:8946_t:CDS:2 [Entrophospora sp. SA101]